MQARPCCHVWSREKKSSRPVHLQVLCHRCTCVYEHETLAISEALLKREDKLSWYHIHVVTDHKALEFFKMQTQSLTSRQMRWMDYLAQSDFGIGYVKGSLNKILDGSPWGLDVHLDPEHGDLPLECLFEVEEGVIESRVHRANTAKVVAEIQALQEHIQERDISVASIVASQQTETLGLPDSRTSGGGLYGLQVQSEERGPLRDDGSHGHVWGRYL